MKSLAFISLVLILTGLAFAQQYKPYNTFNKEDELQNFIEHGGKVEEVSPDVYKLTSRVRESKTFYLGRKENVNERNGSVSTTGGSAFGGDTTIINVWEIDTTKFAGMYKFWQKVEVSNISWVPFPVDDLNNNGRPELYGYTDIIGTDFAGPVKIFERNLNGIYQDIFTYDSTSVIAKGIADMSGDGNKEIILASLDDVFFFYPVFKSDTANSLPETFDFFFYLDTLQINEMAIGDLDNNGKIDCSFTTPSVWDTTMCAIAEYRDSINNFEEVFRFKSIFENDLSGFAIDDFDRDGKTELVISSGPGNVFVIENEGENAYSVVNQFPFPTPNSYMQTATNDIDENGKPEFWVGGQDFEEGITIIQAYEADKDNGYKPVARIELRYLTSLAFNQCIQDIDIDYDGKEELIISIGNAILILKFVGLPGNHQYKLWYAKLGEATQTGAQFYPAAVTDLDGDGKKDLLIPMTRYTPSITYAFSYILRRDKTSGVNESVINGIPLEFIYSYPNPFNSEGTISFRIIETSNVQLKIYNTLGKEIELLLDKEFSPGDYTIPWDAKDKLGNSLSSGVYLIVLKTNNSIKTFKSVLLK